VAYDNNEKKLESVYSIRVKAGKRRTYFFDVRETRGSDFYLTITESRKRFDSDGYDRHKIFLYKEDFNKFLKGLNETVEHVKTVLMPDFDFDAFNHDTPYEGDESGSYNNEYASESNVAPIENTVETTTNDVAPSTESTYNNDADNGSTDEVDKW
jgi:hypothetical protein